MKTPTTRINFFDLLFHHKTEKSETALCGVLAGSGKYNDVWDILKERFGEPIQKLQIDGDKLRKFLLVMKNMKH